MSKEDFIKTLSEHNLTCNQFLDLRDEWNRLSGQDKYDLLKEELERESQRRIEEGEAQRVANRQKCVTDVF